MSYHALIYHVVEDYVEKRVPYRANHLRLAEEAVKRGELLLGGALGEPPDSALLVFQVPDPSVIEAFVRSDPYVLNGIVRRWEIKPYAVVVGTKM